VGRSGYRCWGIFLLIGLGVGIVFGGISWAYAWNTHTHELRRVERGITGLKNRQIRYRLRQFDRGMKSKGWPVSCDTIQSKCVVPLKSKASIYDLDVVWQLLHQTRLQVVEGYLSTENETDTLVVLLR
jgi:hypothetical protein